jgi:hypothetical protein
VHDQLRDTCACRPAREVGLEECDELIRALWQRATALCDLVKVHTHHTTFFIELPIAGTQSNSRPGRAERLAVRLHGLKIGPDRPGDKAGEAELDLELNNGTGMQPTGQRNRGGARAQIFS